MGFGSREMDNAYDRWVTQTPEEYFGLPEYLYCNNCNKKICVDDLDDEEYEKFEESDEFVCLNCKKGGNNGNHKKSI